MREALVDLAAVRPAMVKATIKARTASARPAKAPAHVLNYAAPRPVRVVAPLKVALRPRVHEVAAIAVAR